MYFNTFTLFYFLQYIFFFLAFQTQMEKVLIKNRTLTCLDKSDNSIDVLFMIYTNCQSYYNFWQIALACVF